MTGFEQTPTGYRATDEQVEWWQSRDLCPSCTAIVEPYMMHSDGRKVYRHDCDTNVEWSSYSPADVAPATAGWCGDGVNLAADPAWVAARDQAGKMTRAEAEAYYAALERP